MGTGSGRYRLWDKEELAALRIGVSRHGAGNWEKIRSDPELAVLQGRSGIQVKDKWRNLVKFKHVSQDEIDACKKVSRPKPPPRRSVTFNAQLPGASTPVTSQLPTPAAGRTQLREWINRSPGLEPIPSEGSASETWPQLSDRLPAGGTVFTAPPPAEFSSQSVAPARPAGDSLCPPAPSGVQRTRRPVKASRTAPCMREMLAGSMSTGGIRISAARLQEPAGLLSDSLSLRPPPVTTGQYRHLGHGQQQQQPLNEFDVQIETGDSLQMLRQALLEEDSPRALPFAMGGGQRVTTHRSGSANMEYTAPQTSTWAQGPAEWADTHQRTVTSDYAAAQPNPGPSGQLPVTSELNPAGVQWNESNMQRLRDLGQLSFTGQPDLLGVPGQTGSEAELYAMSGAGPGLHHCGAVGHQDITPQGLADVTSIGALDVAFENVFPISEALEQLPSEHFALQQPMIWDQGHNVQPNLGARAHQEGGIFGHTGQTYL